MLRKVMNLSTGEELHYFNLTPSRAVMWAYYDSIGKRNTWTYEKEYARDYSKLSWGKWSVAMGDFACATIIASE